MSSRGTRQAAHPNVTTNNGKQTRLSKKERTPKEGKDLKTSKEETMNNEDSKSSARNVSGICSPFVPTARTGISYAVAGKHITAPHNRLFTFE